MTTSDLDLARLHTEALFVHDPDGRLLAINEPDPETPAPRFFLIRTVAGNLWRVRHDLPAGLAAELERLAAGEPVRADLRAPPRHAAAYSALLARHAPLSHTDAGPAYYLPESDPPAGAITITPENAIVLQAHYPYTRNHLAELAPVVAVVQNGVAVATCYSARITARVAEAGVHTLPAYRGRSYAAATTCGWAAALRAMGRQPLYSTSWTNTASQAVAAKLGAVQYAVEFSIT